MLTNDDNEYSQFLQYWDDYVDDCKRRGVEP